MPYLRTNRGRIFRKRRIIRRKKSKQLATKGFVKRQIRSVQEKKYYDVADSDNVDFSGVVDPLTDISQGDTDTSRDGDKLLPISLRLTFKFEVSDTNNVCRLIVFRWHAVTTNDTPTPAKILQVVGTAYAPLSPYIHDTRSRFTVLLDKSVMVDSYDPSAYRIFNIRLKKSHIKYEAAGTEGKDKLYVLRITDSGVASHPSITFYSRVIFTDS